MHNILFIGKASVFVIPCLQFLSNKCLQDMLMNPLEEMDICKLYIIM